jgi:hypothetical protein
MIVLFSESSVSILILALDAYTHDNLLKISALVAVECSLKPEADSNTLSTIGETNGPRNSNNDFIIAVQVISRLNIESEVHSYSINNACSFVINGCRLRKT